MKKSLLLVVCIFVFATSAYPLYNTVSSISSLDRINVEMTIHWTKTVIFAMPL